MSQAVRLFIAIELPHNLQNDLNYQFAQMRPNFPASAIRWIPPQNLHLTLKFLGDTPPAKIDEIGNQLELIGKNQTAFSVKMNTVGCFPTLKKPRVLWIGLEDEQETLINLQQGVENRIVSLGFPSDSRAFRPHLTIGRVKRHVNDTIKREIGQVVKQVSLSKKLVWPCDTISLMQSELTPDGAIYTCLKQASFRG